MSRYPEEVDGEPRLEILEHPKSRGFRFRYTCEGPSHGGIPGASSDKNKKTFPAVKIVNYQGYARIVVQLVTNEENPRLHPHSLVGKQCQNGICTVQCGPKDMTATFPNLGIQHVTKKNVASILEERYIAAEMQLSSINDGFPQEVQRNIKDEDRKRIAAKAQSEAKSIDLSVVRLMFIAYLPDSQGAFTIMLKPIISDAIFDSKAPNAATLKICRMDCNAGSASGGDEVYLLCDKVQKDDIQVRFVEEDPHGREVWENYGSFCPTDVHRQFAIVFRTPPYKDQYINQAVNVNVQLRRKSDGEVSEPRTFTYLPNKTDFDMIERKRRKMIPDYLDHIGGNNAQGYNFSAPAPGGNSVQGPFQFDGASGSSNEKKAAVIPPLVMSKKANPQKGPVEPHLLLRKFQPSKPEPIPTTAAQIKQEYIPDTRIPMPKILQNQNRISNGIPNVYPSSRGMRLISVSTQASKRSHASFETSTTERACVVPCPSKGFVSSPDLRQSVEMSNMQTQFTEQFFVTPTSHHSRHNQVPVSTSAALNTTSASFPLSEFSTSNVISTQTAPTLDSGFDILDLLLNDIEADGHKSVTSRHHEHDFSAVLYDEENLSAYISSPENDEFSDNSVESDSTVLVSDLEKLSLIGSSSPPRDLSFRNKSEISTKTTENEKDSGRNKNLIADIGFKMAEAEKMASAIQNFSMTGDVRALLRLPRHLASTRNENGDTALHLAVIYDQLEVLVSLLDVIEPLESRCDILNSVNNDQQTALQIAALTDNVEAVIELLELGADPLIVDRNGNHSIHVACRHGNADILSRLLKATNTQKFDKKNYKGLGCSHLAVKAKRNNVQCLRLLRDHLCDINAQDARTGQTALHMSVELKKLDMVRCIVSQCDANVEVTTFNGYTPLHLASASGSYEISSYLLFHGANPEMKSIAENLTPLDLAPSEKMRDILKGKVKLLSFDETNTNNITNQDILFDRELRNRFCTLLNSEETGSNWNELADRLQLSQTKPSLQSSDNPTATLIQTYWLSHGTVDGLRSALMNIGRHDAVQILNRALHCKLDEATWHRNKELIY